MSGKPELLAILKAASADIEALIGIVGSISLTGFNLKDQGESGLEVRRILYRFVEKTCDAEMRLIDLHREFADKPGMTDLERSQYRANRADDLGDMTQDAYERINDYVHGRAA
ncbi:hypothetical protein EHE22_09045 [Ochrobactrum pseudogrignonense]|uniref:Uncharacterized protein n=1 Tax=Brucella pseudogrignonensis TaxID=419475 RepID=A0A7Y3T3V9_9HYPH|nr:hypothetical protein [Brucella pseudogrignonensis]NNV20569.1 hypothetical protein [Brucella pseudogrignonensis]